MATTNRGFDQPRLGHQHRDAHAEGHLDPPGAGESHVVDEPAGPTTKMNLNGITTARTTSATGLLKRMLISSCFGPRRALRHRSETNSAQQGLPCHWRAIEPRGFASCSGRTRKPAWQTDGAAQPEYPLAGWMASQRSNRAISTLHRACACTQSDGRTARHLLFLHGFPGILVLVAPATGSFHRDYRCVAIDLRG